MSSIAVRLLIVASEAAVATAAAWLMSEALNNTNDEEQEA